MRTAVVALASLTLIAATTATAVGSSSASPGLGAPGIGDPYFPHDGNGGYDVQRYGIHVAFNPRTHGLVGSVAIKARSLQPLARFDLDLVGLKVDAVHVNGANAKWSRGTHELRVRPKHALAKGHHFTVRIRYHGTPRVLHEGDLGDNGVFPTADGSLVVGQPHVAATWFPVNDHPRDKASYAVDITVPKGLEALSNGRLARKHTRGGHTTWSWKESAPMASYLATATTGQFKLKTYKKNGISYVDAIDPTLYGISAGPGATIGSLAEEALDEQPKILKFLEGVLGPYPFKDAGGIVDNDPDIGFALENQTRPIYAKAFFASGDLAANDGVVTHELAHQWTGDSLALGRWQDIWLNEGFATYMEWLWSEDQGRDTADTLYDNIASIPADSSFWSLKIGAPGASNIFADSTYYRGAMTLHALRHKIGNATFFRLVKRWTSSHAGGNVTTPQFIALAESISGQDLGAFFRTWLYTASKPAGLPSSKARRGAPADPLGHHLRR
jgi:aminopeptidase N